MANSLAHNFLLVSSNESNGNEGFSSCVHTIQTHLMSQVEQITYEAILTEMTLLTQNMMHSQFNSY